MKIGPNNMSGVIWAPGKFLFLFLFIILFDTKVGSVHNWPSLPNKPWQDAVFHL